MLNTHLPGRMAASLSALALATGGLTACGGSSGSSHTNTGGARTATAPTVSTAPGSSARTGAASPAARPTGRGALPATAPARKPAPSVTRAASSPQARAFRSALVSFASCLRGNGVKIPAPNTSGKGPVFGSKGLNTNTPQYRAALAKCRGVLASAFRQAAKRAR